MSAHDWTVVLCWLNLSLLLAHQIDSAFGKEWDPFHVPGGNQVNLILNLVLLLVGIAGFGLLVDGRRPGLHLSLLVAFPGIFAFTLHAWFLIRGDHRFRQPVSIALLTSTLPISVLQVAVSLGEMGG